MSKLKDRVKRRQKYVKVEVEREKKRYGVGNNVVEKAPHTKTKMGVGGEFCSF